MNLTWKLAGYINLISSFVFSIVEQNKACYKNVEWEMNMFHIPLNQEKNLHHKTILNFSLHQDLHKMLDQNTLWKCGLFVTGNMIQTKEMG